MSNLEEGRSSQSDKMSCNLHPEMNSNPAATAEVIDNLNNVIGLIEAKLKLSCNDEVKAKIQEAIQLLESGSKSDGSMQTEQKLNVAETSNAKQYRTVEVQTRESMFKMHINELPNECIMMILKFFPLQKMIPLRIICKRWKDLIVAICLQRKSLKLFKGLGDCKMYCRKIYRLRLDCLKLNPAEDLAIKLRHYGDPLLQFITEIFPNIEKLVFSCATQLESPQLALLFQRWPNLNNLTLHGDIDFEPCVFESFKQLPELRQLYLLIRTAHNPLPAKLMSQLDHFTLGVTQYNEHFNQALAFLKPTCSVALDTNYALFEQIAKIFTNPRKEFTINVVHLQIARVYEDQQLRFITKRLSNLQYLEFTGCQVSDNLSVLMLNISHLEHLVELRVDHLDINFAVGHHSGNHICLPSLRRLTLVNFHYSPLGNEFNGHKWCRTLARIFPNLVDLSVVTWKDHKRTEIIDNLKLFPNLIYGNIM